MIDAVANLLDASIRRGHPPAAACSVWVDGAVVHSSAHGSDPEGRPVTLASIFDVASVTKVVVTTALVARLVRNGTLELDASVCRWLPEFPHPEVTVRSLLAHRSGLPAWYPFFVAALPDPLAPSPASLALGKARVLEAVFASPLPHPGRRVYSDLGFLTLGALVERAGGAGLEVAANELHLDRDVGYAPVFGEGRAWLADRHVLPTGVSRPREPAPGQESLYSVPAQTPRPDRGRVDDDNAFAMGGVAGHAGAFATADAIAAFGGAIVEELDGSDSLGIGPELMAELVTVDHGATEGPPRALGFDVPTGDRSSAGGLGRGPRGAIGHLGFTGCSLWVDLDRRAAVALLTNRTLPGREHVDAIRALRPAIHDAVTMAL